jgi:hypothetical protein
VIDIMSKELGWDRERQDKEFRDATKFLTSMGCLKPKKTESQKETTEREGHAQSSSTASTLRCRPYPHPADLARTVFSPDELKTLRKRFAKIDGAFSLN